MGNLKKPTFVSDGYEINNGCRIRRIEITNGFYYYQVKLQRISGNHIRKSFITAKQARSFAEQIGVIGAEDGIKVIQFINPQWVDAVKETGLDLFHAGLRMADRYWTNHNDCIHDVRTLVKEFAAERQGRIDRGELLSASVDAAKRSLKRFSAEFGPRAVDTLTAGEMDRFLNEVNGASSRRSHQLHISAFFNWAVAREQLAFNPLGPTFADDGYEINNGCRIRRIKAVYGFHYYQVALQKISGNHIRKSFITAKKARLFAGRVGEMGPGDSINPLRLIDPDRIDAVKASILDLFNNINHRKAA